MRVWLRKALRFVLVAGAALGALLVAVSASLVAGLPPYPYVTGGIFAGDAASATSTLIAVVVVAVGVATVVVTVTLLFRRRAARGVAASVVPLPTGRRDHAHEQRKAA